MREITKYHDTSKTVKERAKNKLFGAVYSHTAIILLLILLQIGIMVLTFTYLGNYSTYMNGVMSLLSFITAIYIFNEKGNPAFKMTWILFVFLVPVVGVGFYLFTKAGIGTKYLGARLEKLRVETEPYMQQNEYVVHAMKGGRVANANLSHFLYNQVGFPTYGNSQAQYFPLGDDKFPILIEELNKAEKFIFMEYFIIQEGKMWNAVLDIMKEKAAAGVDVRLMYDDLGTIQTLPPHYYRQMEEAGIKCAVFNPFRPRLNSMFNYRDHRKITVIDGDVGFCGGLNLADEYINAYERYGHWKDTAVMLRGDGTWNLTMMFLQLWSYRDGKNADYHEYQPSGRRYGDDGYVQPYGDSPIDEVNVAESIYLQMINCAKKYVYITTPYLILDNEMTTALIIAAQSGVDVRIITPHIPDKWYVHAVTRSSYRQLIEAGVRIYEYTPGFIHAKMFVADDEVGVVGTANMDYRSFYLHFECGVAFFRCSVIQTVKQDILKTMEISQEIHPNPEERIPLLRRLGRAILKAFAPLM